MRTNGPMRNYSRIEKAVSPEMEKVLLQYLDIQRRENELQSEKESLKEKILQFLNGEPDGFWFPSVDGVPLKVRYAKENVVKYDEEAIRARLGERYLMVAGPDLQKIRANLSEIEPLLAPLAAKIFSTDREKVRSAIGRGLVRQEEFAGTFRKSVRTRIAVMKDRQNQAGGIEQ